MVAAKRHLAHPNGLWPRLVPETEYQEQCKSVRQGRRKKQAMSSITTDSDFRDGQGGENGSMRAQGIRSVRTQNTLHSRTFPPPLSDGVPYIFLPALLSYVAIALHLGLCENPLHYRKLATIAFFI
jgi:hypothetical protein